MNRTASLTVKAARYATLVWSPDGMGGSAWTLEIVDESAIDTFPVWESHLDGGLSDNDAKRQAVTRLTQAGWTLSGTWAAREDGRGWAARAGRTR